MTLEQDIKQETSVPTSARVSIVVLAELDRAWQLHNRMPRSMSQLISWSLELLVEVLDAKGQLPDRFGVAEAHKYLQSRGLYQGITKKRGFKKIVTAMGFEAMRAQGINPKDVAPRQYSELHNPSSVEPKPQKTRLADIDEALQDVRREGVREESDEERDARIRRTDALLAQARINARVAEGMRQGMSEDELDRHDRMREEDRRKLENQPPNLDDIDFADE